MCRKVSIFILAFMCVGTPVTARMCPPPPPTGSGDYVDDCRDVFRVECPSQGRVATGFLARVQGQTGIITALHGVVGCSQITAFNLGPAYRDLRIRKVDIARDAALVVSPELNLAGEGLQFSSQYQNEQLRVLGYPQGLGHQFSHRVETNLPPLRPLRTTLPDAQRIELEERGSPDVGQTILSLSGAIQHGYSGAPILTWAGSVVGVANGGLKAGSVDIGWAMLIDHMRWDDARTKQNELNKLSGGKPSALFGAQASPRSTLPPLYIADGGSSIGRIYKVHRGRLSQIYARPSGRLYSIATSPNGRIYFSNANDYEIYRLDGEREVKIFTHTTYTRDIEFDAQGRFYFSESSGAGKDGIIYRLQSGRAKPYFRVRLRQIGGFWAGDFAFDHKGALWLSNGNRVPAALYKVIKRKPQRMFTASTSIKGFTFTGDGDLLYTDFRQRIQRIELPGFLTSEAVHAPHLKWLTDVSGLRGPR